MKKILHGDAGVFYYVLVSFMPQLKRFVKKPSKFYRSLVATALITNGIFQFVAPVIAEGTKAGQSISNTAEATYEDPDNPGTTINATSNTVVVEVAEVAGITVTASGTAFKQDANNNGTVNSGDTVYYNYTITNVGNDTTQFRIPNLAKTTGAATVAGNVEYSANGGNTWTPINSSEVITSPIPVNGTVLVRVPVTVAAGAQTNDVITVTFGDTPGDAQNQLRSPNGGDVYTVDSPDSTANEANGAPVNGVREASATQQVKVDSGLKTYALTKVMKMRTGYNNAGTQAINDDILSYSLSLEVENNDPTGNGITPAPLVGRAILGLTGSRILISDAIPAGTQLAVAPIPIPGWQVVYTDQDPSVATNSADKATWKLMPANPSAAELASVKRIGFVNDPTVVTSIAPGTIVNGFNIQIKTTGAPNTGGTDTFAVNNIAQLFGGTPDNDNDPNTSGAPVFDESGDNNPSNFDDDGTPFAGTDANNDRIPDQLPNIVPDGYVNDPTDLNNIGSDSGNNNTGTGTGGETNTFTISEPVASSVLNGTDRTPDATGPVSAIDSTGTNSDFTNKSSLVPPNIAPDSGNTIPNPSPVAFTNTVQNNGTSPNSISLIPTPPTNTADLPTGATVTISYGSESKVYTWNGSQFQFNGGAIDQASEYITIPNLAPGAAANYGVEVKLPANTPLSTDLDTSTPDPNDLIGGFSVPITAFIDDATPGLQTEPSNTTIDRVYTGYLRMVKESRILAGTGPAPQGTDAQFSTAPKKPAPGNIIEYRITYTNISDAQAGTGNKVLRANELVITEDGTAGGNNWAIDNDVNGQIDTSNVVGTAKDSGTSTIRFHSGNPASNVTVDQTGTTVDTDVTKYINSVTGSVEPGQSRNFIFQRRMN
ncbi:hypothetical protein RIVM261_015390 [Rivularia sp. IAM M-261]|nr:hypothetical protein RIVM261_015390 [Rivularia sp. IAM M-261]